MSRVIEQESIKEIGFIQAQIASLNTQKSDAIAQTSTAVKELEDVNKKIEDGYKLLEEIEKDLETKRNHVADLLVYERESKQEIEKNSIIAKNIMSAARAVEASINSQSQEKLAKQRKTIQANDLIIAQQEEVIKNNEVIKSRFDLKLSSSNGEILELSDSIKESLTKRDLLNSEILDVSSKIASANLELESVMELIEKEKEKIQLPMRSLDEREAEINRKERDLNIYASRVHARFKMLFPNQSMPI